MTIDRATEAEIRRLFFGEHWKKGTIVEQLGVHRDVVERVVGALGPAPKDREAKTSVLDPYRGFVLETLERYPTLSATRLFDMLGERGYTGSLRTLRRFVLCNRPARRSQVYLRLETLPGEQAQIDWAHVGQLRVPGGVRPLYCFVLLLRYSRAMWAELVLEQTTTSLLRSLVRAAEHFGGVTHEWLFDNPRSIVAAREGRAIRFQEALVDLASQLHVALRACRVRTPTDKGGVERAIRYLKTRFFPARPIASLESGNDALGHFLETVAHHPSPIQGPHPTQKGRTVAECLAEEKTRLLPLPSAAIPTELVTSVPADKTAFISFDANRYSVHHGAADRVLTLVATDTEVRLLDGTRLVGAHARVWGKSRVIEAPEHREALLLHKAGARDGKGRDRLRAQIPRVEELMRRWLEDGRNVGSLVARTLKLLDLYGPSVLAAAVGDLLDKDSHDYGALAILCEQRCTRPRRLLPIELAPHVVDRDVIPHDLGGYDDDGQ